jgi:putative GTP pyrophosphokinase
VPSPLQRKLNSLAGLFETADDQFDRVRADREAYVSDVRESKAHPKEFLQNELNKDSFLEYLNWKFPSLPVAFYDGQINLALDLVDKRKFTRLSDLDAVVEKTTSMRRKVNKKITDSKLEYMNYAAPQVALALALEDDTVRNNSVWNEDGLDIILEDAIRELQDRNSKA